jgi:hypothetical protein
LPRAGTRRAFQYVDGIWWDSTKRVPDSLLVRHRSFEIGPELTPWKIGDAWKFSTLAAARKEMDQYCHGDWTPLRLTVPDRLGNVPFRQLATLEIEPEGILIKNGFPFPRSGSPMITQDDFPYAIVPSSERPTRTGTRRRFAGTDPARDRATNDHASGRRVRGDREF